MDVTCYGHGNGHDDDDDGHDDDDDHLNVKGGRMLRWQGSVE